MLGLIGTALKWLILLPILAVLALLAVANDHMVHLSFNPFDPADEILRVELAMYQVAFLAFVLGALVAAAVVWSGQRKYRRRARSRETELALLRDRAQRSAPQSGPLIAGPRRS